MSAGSHSPACRSPTVSGRLMRLDEAVRVISDDEMCTVLNLIVTLIFECVEAPVSKMQLFDVEFDVSILEDKNNNNRIFMSVKTKHR